MDLLQFFVKRQLDESKNSPSERICPIVYIHFDSYSFRGNLSRAETIQRRKVLIFRWFRPRKLFKGGKYSRAETIRGNTVYIL